MRLSPVFARGRNLCLSSASLYNPSTEPPGVSVYAFATRYLASFLWLEVKALTLPPPHHLPWLCQLEPVVVNCGGLEGLAEGPHDLEEFGRLAVGHHHARTTDANSGRPCGKTRG